MDFAHRGKEKMKLIDLDDDRHCYIGNDGEYERWNIYPDASTIDPVKHGKWDKDSIAFYWRCSECGAIVKSNLWDVFLDPFSSHRDLNYCPHCGAKMKGEEGEE